MSYGDEVYSVDSSGYVQPLHDCSVIGDGNLFACNGDTHENIGDSRLLCFREIFSSTSTDFCPFEYEVTLTTQCHETNVLGKIWVIL